MTAALSKVCKECDVEKKMAQFYKNVSMDDGRLNICIQCTVKRQAVYREEKRNQPSEVQSLLNRWAMNTNNGRGYESACISQHDG